MPSALASLASLAGPLVLLDVGCRWGIPPAWTAAAPGALRVFAFDADEEECRRLQETAPAGVTYVPRAIAGHDGRACLHIADEPACSSLFAPDPEALATFPQLCVAREVGRREIEVQTLDTWASQAGVVAADAMKLDVQGAELEVLRGATDLLRSVRVIEAEVSFNAIYAGQPLFGEVDAFLRSHGFRLWRLGHMVHYTSTPERTTLDGHDQQFFDGQWVQFSSGPGQLSWGHAYFCAADLAASRWPDAQAALRDACAAELLGLHDLAAAALAGAGAAADEPPG